MALTWTEIVLENNVFNVSTCMSTLYIRYAVWIARIIVLVPSVFSHCYWGHKCHSSVPNWLLSCGSLLFLTSYMPVYLFVYSSFVLAQISDYSICHSLFGGTLRSTHWDPDRFNFYERSPEQYERSPEQYGRYLR